jgi:L-arabinose isomerase
MIDLHPIEAWLAVGSQELYGPAILSQVAADAGAMARGLSESPRIPVKIVLKPTMTTPEAILNLAMEANAAPNCVGLIAWMHTFSPARMWIAGLRALNKPFLHLHTQFNREIPWSTIDMDFMNLNQSAHGDREFGFIGTRLRSDRKVIVGHWQEEDTQDELAAWLRAACAWHDWQGARVARFGDNMREVAVTEGDKVEAQIRFGYAVNGFPASDLAACVQEISDAEVNRLVSDYGEQYVVAEALRPGGRQHGELQDAARIELGLRAFLQQGGFTAFTTNFQDLTGLPQMPGLAVQRLMADGFGFGGEGDWKTAALIRAMKVMSAGLTGGTSFMEDYTYDLRPGQMKVLGAHMLEICPSIAAGRPALQVHPLFVGGKADPPRLVFDAAPGPALNATMIDLGNRFRLIVNEVQTVPADEPLPHLPVARAVWVPQPDLKVAATAWILAGGAHHTGFSQAVTAEHLENFADMAGIEYLLIDQNTRVSDFKKELRWNEVYYHLARGL